MDNIDDEARMLAVRWVESEVKEFNNIWDKHKLASDIMNYARRKMSDQEATNKELIKVIEAIVYADGDSLADQYTNMINIAEGALKVFEKKTKLSEDEQHDSSIKGV